MFERFSQGAREAVVAAHSESGDRIRPEHLLIGVAATSGRASQVLARHGATPEALRAATAPDADALAAIGIDLDEVRRRAEASFGPGALYRGRGRGRHRPFTAEAKKALELSLREAVHLGDRQIGAEHVVLGLLREGEVEPLLARVGAPAEAIRADLSPAANRRGRGG